MIDIKTGTVRKLVITGLGMASTGLGRVLLELIRHLRTKWDLSVILHDSDGSIPIISGVKILTIDYSLHVYKGLREIQHHLTTIGPDCALFLSQPWKLPSFLSHIRHAVPETKIALYMPVEGKPSGDAIANSASVADLCIVYTHAIRDQLINYGLNLAVIGHGCDLDSILSERKMKRCDLRQQLFPEVEDLWSKTLILNSNRMYFRKRFDLCIAGFALAAKRIDANLYLHIPGLSRYELNKLRQQIYHLQVEDRIFINVLNPQGEAISFKDLVRLMQSCDIGLTTSMGEGWGLGTFEHAATGAAQIVPDHIGFRENWGPKSAVFVPCDAPFFVENEAVEMFPPSVDGIAGALVSLLNSPEELKKMSCCARQNAIRKERSWKFISKKFDIALKRLFEA